MALATGNAEALPTTTERLAMSNLFKLRVILFLTTGELSHWSTFLLLAGTLGQNGHFTPQTAQCHSRPHNSTPKAKVTSRIQSASTTRISRAFLHQSFMGRGIENFTCGTRPLQMWHTQILVISHILQFCTRLHLSHFLNQLR